jgi:hypothetical protein
MMPRQSRFRRPSQPDENGVMNRAKMRECFVLTRAGPLARVRKNGENLQPALTIFKLACRS